MAVVIDRRTDTSSKHLKNRQKFLERSKDKIREVVARSVSDKSIKEIGSDEKVKVRSKDISEPTFREDPESGENKGVLPGNKEFSEGDITPKPQKSGGSGKEGSDDPDSMEDFHFVLTREEFLQYLFEDLELPDFIKESIKVTDAKTIQRVGFTNTGSPANLSIMKTFKKSIGRRLALGRPTDDELLELEEDIAQAEKEGNVGLAISLLEKLEILQAKRRQIPFIEENDLRYTYYEQKPNPSSQAVMFCLMDVSGSMGEKEKDIAKRFFLLLYLFLERKYDKIDIRFIRHTTTAQDVDEKTFFYDQLSGGTAISSGLQLISEIIDQEYSPSEWNIYLSQVTDGDNSSSDNKICQDIIESKLQPILQYFAYVQVSPPDDSTNQLMASAFGYGIWSAWPLYQELSQKYENIVARQVFDQSEIWKLFVSLFSRKEVA